MPTQTWHNLGMTQTSTTTQKSFRRAALAQAIENYNLAYSRGDSANTAYWEREVARRSRVLDMTA